MAESRTFLHDLKTIGGVKDGDLKNAFVFTFKEATEAGLSEEGTETYVNARTGDPFLKTSTPEVAKGFEGIFDPTFDMYIPKALYDSYSTYKKITRGNIATGLTGLAEGAQTAEGRAGLTAVSFLTHALLKVNSMGLAFKTVFNPLAYHLRNMLTALSSYSAALGVSPGQVFIEFALAFRRSRQPEPGAGVLGKLKAYTIGRDPRIKTDEQLIWQRMGIDQGQLDFNYLAEMFQTGKGDPYNTFFAGFDELMKLSSEDMTEKGLIKKGWMKVTKGGDLLVGPTFRRLASFAAGIDTATKLAIFKKELSVLKKARKYDQDNEVDTGYLGMTDEQMEFEAARKTRAMAPTYSEAPVTAKVARKLNPLWGDPFLSFWLDQFRIVWNQMFAIPKEETDSLNPIIQSRGRVRRAMAMSVHAAVPAVSIGSAMLLKMNPTDDEEELLKEHAPPWGKQSQYIYLPGSVLNKLFGVMGADYNPDSLYSLDLTYINASSPVFDGSTAAALEILRGDSDKAFKNLYAGYIKRFMNPSLLGATAI